LQPDGTVPPNATPAGSAAAPPGLWPAPPSATASGYPTSGPPTDYPQAGYQQAGYPAAGYPQGSYPPAGYQQVGYPGAAYPAYAAVPGATVQAGGGRRRTMWWIIGVVVLALVIVIAAVAIGSSSSKKQADLSVFCSDFEAGWSDVVAGAIVAEVLVDDINNNPGTFTGASADDMNAMNTANEQATVIANEAPASLHDKISGIAKFLSVMVKVGGNDQSAINNIPTGGFDEDADALSASVPLQQCAGQ
jgi:hypothetical protein